MCDVCTSLLNEALNLAVRSEKFEEQNRRRNALAASRNADEWEQSGRFAKYVEMWNIRNPHRQIAKTCLTQHMWVEDQYDKDLADWQARARLHLMQGCRKTDGAVSHPPPAERP